MHEASVRSDISVATSVWKALFLREITARLAEGRAAWLWILIEPAAHLIFLMGLFGYIRHQGSHGTSIEIFILLGVWGFFLVGNIGKRGMEAIHANMALFAYRQVKPVDTVLIRAVVEAFLYSVVVAILLTALALLEIDVIPDDPLLVAWAAFLLWAFGLGLALVLSVANTLLPAIAKIVKLAFGPPLYFLSAVMYSASSLPRSLRDVVLVNPITHGLEAMRSGWFPAYHGEGHVSLLYLTFCALITVFLGLALHRRYEARLTAQ